MPNSVVFQQPFRRRGQNWLPPTKPPLADVTGAGGLVIGGAATVEYSHAVGVVVGSGGVVVGGAGSGQFVHGPQVPSDIVVEWDLDNDGDFSAAVEDITEYVLSLETFTGRDWPSLLTGRAGPGRLSMTLRNDDDRFNYFNGASPLVTAPFSLSTGRKVRVRTAAATTLDPAVLTRDRFRRADGALGDTETGLTWVEPLTDDFTISENRAVATNDGADHMAVTDVGAADYYVQAEFATVGLTGNRVGLVYRYVDSDDYSALVVDVASGSVKLVNVTAGVFEDLATQGIETYSGVTLGVLVSGTTVTAYLEGVELFSATAVNTTAESVGFYASWTVGQDRPAVDNFWVWDGLPARVDGVLWTGDISELSTSVVAGPEKLARVTGQGWLSRLATQNVTPPTSLTGRSTGLLMGNVLASAQVLHPPGTIDSGDITTGTFVIAETSALEVARRVEETEYGFLYETQEGPLSFESRSARDGRTSLATFSDAAGGKYGYHKLEPYDWRREVFNRIVAGVSTWDEGPEAVLFTDPGPYVLTAGQTRTIAATYDGAVSSWTGHTRNVVAPGGDPGGITVTDFTSFDMPGSIGVTLPATVDAGDLLLILVAEWDSGPWGAEWQAPAGWTILGSSEREAVMAKVAVGDEDSDVVFVSTDTADSTAMTAQLYHVTDWHGTLDGVAVNGYTGTSGSSPSSSPITPSWGAVPTLHISYWMAPYVRTQTGVPSGYGNTTTTQESSGDPDLTMGSAYRIASVTTENAGFFTLSSSVPQWRARAVAIRGGSSTTARAAAVPSGPDGTFTIAYDVALGGTSQSHENIEVSGIPLVQADAVNVQADDYDSQDDHNSIRTYQNSANLFGSTADAQTYADLVLSVHATDRPILSLSFYASKSAAYRSQAFKRRVGDRITLVADNTTGMGVDQDFYIESIGHRWSHGTRLWETTWELSPA